MADSALIDRLAQHRTLGAAPREELAWLAAHGYLRRGERGEVFTRDHEFVDKMVVVLSGHITIYVDRGLGPRKVMEWGAGDVTGYLPYSRMDRLIGAGAIDEQGDMFLIPRSEFPEMIRQCPTVTTTLVHLLLDRVRRFTSSDLQDEKMVSLGRLSAGLAHELNNPASAAARSAQLLPEGLDALESAARDLAVARLSAAQQAAIKRSQRACASGVSPMRSPIERADREDAITAWLDQHGADRDAAAALVDTELTLDDFDRLAALLDGSALNAALRWIAADCTTRALAAELERAAMRIHTLIAAVKRFSYMDRASTPEPIELAASLRDSLALLMHKARKKSVQLSVDLDPSLPYVRAIGGDLNQVWMNLLDNALDAVSEGGRVTVTAERHVDFLIVHVVDDGPGIPADIIERVFDPFFTTKPVGQGTGLGLDIAQRLVRRNDGDISVESRPGRTEFTVSLPVADPRAASSMKV